MLGDTDPSSLADYGYCLEVAQQMGVIPISTRNIAMLCLVAVVPFVPLLFTTYSFNELMKRLLGTLV